VSQSERFLAEEILRQAASGQIPSEGDLLVRGPNGWFFGSVGAPSNPEDPIGQLPAPGGGGGGGNSFVDLVDNILDVQATESSVKQHEAALDIGAIQVFGGVFGIGTPFPDLVYTFPNQMRRALRTITAADTPYTVTDGDWHINVNISLGSVEVLLPTAISRGIPGFTDQLHVKRIGEGDGIVTLLPSTGEFIDDADSAIIRSRNRSFTLVSDAANWWIQ
jgi:hypothetical protein